jgi:hypothetical protein
MEFLGDFPGIERAKLLDNGRQECWLIGCNHYVENGRIVAGGFATTSVVLLVDRGLIVDWKVGLRWLDKEKATGTVLREWLDDDAPDELRRLLPSEEARGGGRE